MIEAQTPGFPDWPCTLWLLLIVMLFCKKSVISLHFLIADVLRSRYFGLLGYNKLLKS